ncbi:conserved hypothetical protein [Magnetococcus marinus MC-1]|uniref:TIGR02646 family protein n=1 Tax=Magnetococcus marinus (strain ATCC BAA-1437 / JCM 17883 / MC-1) TaxID=156889 RepID=A0LBT9_MAGMM|nr:retron Ec78 anti-phage system effector HNH endonuclease PtuB [Magnetococcus marinus]ABK45432.1 conserved hypothetical protein [Magnetococcus marinus MC-1]
MKRIDKQREPKPLKRYRKQHPKASWDALRTAHPAVYPAIKKQLLTDQGGLCAYCEIDLKIRKKPREIDDFRVEHFHPKSDTSGNWSLDWSNMLGVCHGGSQRHVTASGERFSENKRDHSCDVPKGSQHWEQVILNPLQLPHAPSLFRFDRAMGSVRVDEHACAVAGIEVARVQATIDLLNLDCSRLQRMRQRVLDHLNEQLIVLVEQGHTLQQARDRLARAYLTKNHKDFWPVAFFSAIRHYLGQSAERALRNQPPPL